MQQSPQPTYQQQPMAPQGAHIPQGQQQQTHVPQPQHQAGPAAIQQVRPWTNGFWDCCSPFELCCMAYWCPCILHGKTAERRRYPNLTNYSTVNNDCIIWWALACCGFQWVIQGVRRGEIREQYKLSGTPVGDFARSFCCPCCGIMQEEKEITAINAQRATQGYTPAPKMQY